MRDPSESVVARSAGHLRMERVTSRLAGRLERAIGIEPTTFSLGSSTVLSVLRSLAAKQG